MKKIHLVILVVILAGVPGQEIIPQLCLNGTAGGLGCRCTTSLSDMMLPRCDVDCSSRNVSLLPGNWSISQFVRSLDLARNLLTSLQKGKFSGSTDLEKPFLRYVKFSTFLPTSSIPHISHSKESHSVLIS